MENKIDTIRLHCVADLTLVGRGVGNTELVIQNILALTRLRVQNPFKVLIVVETEIMKEFLAKEIFNAAREHGKILCKRTLKAIIIHNVNVEMIDIKAFKKSYLDYSQETIFMFDPAILGVDYYLKQAELKNQQ